MNPAARQLVDRLWNYCNVLRDDGVSSQDYLEQLSFLVFLKMAAEQEELNREKRDPADHKHVLPVTGKWKRRGWKELLDLEGEPLEEAYTKLLADLGRRSADGDHTTLSLIFNRARNRIENPANLRRLIVDLINEEKWLRARSDIKGAAYEALIARSAEDSRGGAGQYFTPRVLIESIVRCMRPTPYDTITDPACGTGGFLLAAYEHIVREYEKDDLPDLDWEELRTKRIWGTEIVPTTARIAAMNLLLHDVGEATGLPVIDVTDALRNQPTRHASMVLANPPFGRKSSVTVSGKGEEDGDDASSDATYYRPDFWLGNMTTTNKQLNFLQHIGTLLTDKGRAAVIVPDSVLYEGGKNSAGALIRRELLTNYNLHTMLRLPENIFQAAGVKAVVLFFDATSGFRSETDPPRTERLWVYDLRTGINITLKKRPLKTEHLADFEQLAFGEDDPDRTKRVESERFHAFDAAKLLAHESVNLNVGEIAMLPAEGQGPTSIAELTLSVAKNLRNTLSEIEAFAKDLGVELPKAEQG
ncbi:type I restriction-modification system subunit M [Streptomyces albulus]|uniref:class I SAM-dependent DNA methyltransferase n=1 Tax=Streptomyces noursei TaxID=1971 RepID=UPI001F43DD68|nr:class I SAM-dependent DNA methyltransferase [Streptomyces noursei]MCE4948751.1 type I restriction-modification system subunit M [Streptomyces noursei]